MHIYGLVAVHFAHHYNARGLPPRCRNVDVVYIYIYNNQDGRTRRDETRRDERAIGQKLYTFKKNYASLLAMPSKSPGFTRAIWARPGNFLGMTRTKLGGPVFFKSVN